MEFQILTMKRTLGAIVMMALMVSSCEKDIDVDLPTTAPKIVVEGSIETGAPPLVLLSRTQGFFDPTTVSSIASSFISDAVVTVDDGTTIHVLDRICSDLIPDSLLEEAAALIGIDAELLAQANICAWTKLDGSLLGMEGRTYRLNVATGGNTLSATTTLPNAVTLDSLWFRLAEQRPDDDTLGFIWGTITDPDTIGNAYRWFARRINAGADGEPKDDRFISPLFSVFEDKYVNGLTFDFFYNRGTAPYSTATDDNNEEVGYFKRGDTVLVKFATIGIDEYRFYESFSNNVSTQGDVFSNPANIRTNINGGLGIWAGLGVRIDTVICTP